jgi:hypothetical protein
VPLHVEGGTDTALSGGGYLTLGALSNKNICVDDNEIMARNNGGSSTLFLNDNGGNVILCRHGDNVAIGADDPGGFRLAVDGQAAKPGGGFWSAFSDVRLKRNVTPLTGTLDRMLQLRGCEFDYTEEAVATRFGLPGRQIGLIAQEVQEVFPEWVEADDEGYLYITQRGTTALFVEALRELRAEKDAEIAALQAKNRQLESRLARIEAMLLETAGGAR